MRYVRLRAKPDTWYIEGTEVWHEDLYKDRKLMTEEQWNECIKDRGIGCVGMAYRDNDIDGEWCSCDEFEVEIVEE